MGDVMKDKEQILYSSDEAATFMTGLSGWVSRAGRFWGDNEHMARWDGSTHIECSSCGIVRLRNGYCSPCHEKKQNEKFDAMELKVWDHNTPLNLHNSDEYFFDIESIYDYAEEHGVSSDSLKLVICNPVKLSQLDEDYFCDELCEDGELPAEVVEGIEALNEVIRNADPVGWEPGKYAAIVEFDTE